jgi:cell division control protein 24
LQAFLIKPIQRICKYPLLFQQLLKACPPDHEFYQELEEGVAACKRITEKVNEAERRAVNAATVKLLEQRVEDWKGHALANFGDLLLDDIFMVTKSDVDREYHVFLFEKIILCCKDATNVPNKKVAKSNSILKKTNSTQAVPATPAVSGAAARKKTTPLLLKGRIFLNNVTQAVPNTRGGECPSPCYFPCQFSDWNTHTSNHFHLNPQANTPSKSGGVETMTWNTLRCDARTRNR